MQKEEKMLKLFRGKKGHAQTVLKNLLSKILDEGKLSLSFQIEQENENSFKIDIFGEDEGLLKTRKGRLLLGFQTYLLQVLYKEFPEEKFRLSVDSNGFWKEQEDKLMSLTDHLVQKALDSNKPVVFKQSLSPYQRRLIHERVAGNTGVRSQSFGNGIYKNLKLIPDTFPRDEK